MRGCLSLTRRALFCSIPALTFLAACGGQGGGRSAAWPDEAQIAALPGYGTERIDEPVFGGTVFVTQAGPEGAPPLVLIHGLGPGGARDWNPVLSMLAKKHRVLAFDLPGFGRSTKANELYTPKRYVELIDWLVTRKFTGKVRMIGHSMGGTLVLKYAGAHPERVEHLVIVDAACILHRHALADFWARSASGGWPVVLPGQGLLLGAARYTLVGMSTQLDIDPGIALASAESRERFLKGRSESIAAVALVREDLGEAVAAVESPTLLIWGAEDDVAPLRTGEVLDALVEDSSLEIFEGTGHAPYQEQPNRFVECVERFFENSRKSIAAAPPTLREEPKGRVGGCQDRRGMVFRGSYARLVIDGCSDVEIRDANVGKLIIDSSSVEINSTHILGGSVGIAADSSRVAMTGGIIAADVAVKTDSTAWDLAGVRITGRAAAFRFEGGSRAILSICPVQSPMTRQTLHGLFELEAGSKL